MKEGSFNRDIVLVIRKDAKDALRDWRLCSVTSSWNARFPLFTKVQPFQSRRSEQDYELHALYVFGSGTATVEPHYK